MTTTLKKTITSIFFLPVLKIGKDRLTRNGFINAYQKDVDHTHYDNCIYVLFKPEDLITFSKFLDEEYERTKAIIDDYDHQDGFVVAIYKLDPKFTKDYELVKQGKYSKTSKAFQGMFPKTLKIVKNGMTREEISLQYRVFNKTDDLRDYWERKLDVTFSDDIEFWDIYEEENEILDIEKIKNHV